MITPAQCRAARALIEWSRDQLADASKVALRTVVDFERGAREPREVTLDAIQRALEAAGVIFVAENGEGPGVRLRKKDKP
ncbi:helix-turn-helix domain-containing protein [Shinella sp. BYT-45]|uniref:helix-turn-helix domain-containing protein n=1 Tax=Shinella sp. BYT-45 TaxID=3377377 RepID=UPI00398014EA